MSNILYHHDTLQCVVYAISIAFPSLAIEALERGDVLKENNTSKEQEHKTPKKGNWFKNIKNDNLTHKMYTWQM